MPIWKTARCSPKATPPRRAGTRAITLFRWRNRFPQSYRSICGCIILSCSPAIPMCSPPKRFPKSPVTAKLQLTTGAIRGTSSLSGKTMSTIFRRSIWWSSFAPHTSVPSPANRRGTSAPCKVFQAGGKSVTCTRQTAKEVRRKNIKVSAAPFEAADTLI